MTSRRALAASLPSLVLLFGLAGVSVAADVPVAGRKLTLRASTRTENPDSHRVRVVLKDEAIGAPFPDPTLGARVVVSGGAEPGQCYAEIELDPSSWTPLGGSGAVTGWRYRPLAAQPGGVRKILIRPGRIVIVAKGAGWPCDLSAQAQRLPVSVRLEVDDVRYCAAFGGSVVRNQAGRVVAKNADAPVVCQEKSDVTAVNLNLLHGLFCSPLSCRQADRIDLLFEWIAASCPDLVTLQEIWVPMAPQIEAQLATACPFPYEMVYGQANDVDDAIVLSRYPVGVAEVVDLFVGFRNVLHVRVDHPIGPLDVFTTHLASGSDGAGNPCGPDCPPECVDAGATTIRQCQAVQTAKLVEARHDLGTPALVTGDFNSNPGSFEYLQMTDRGWIDTYDAAGASCDPVSGLGCGSDRDSSLTDLESPAISIDDRIDYIFLVPPALSGCSMDSPLDDDGDGVATTMWADQPNPFAPSCGPMPEPICWPSDHNGNQLDLECDPG